MRKRGLPPWPSRTQSQLRVGLSVGLPLLAESGQSQAKVRAVRAFPGRTGAPPADGSSMENAGATRSKADRSGGATRTGAEQRNCLPLAEAAGLVGVSVQALRQRIKRGSLVGVRLVLGGRAVVGVSRRELARVFDPSPASGRDVAPPCSAGTPPRSKAEQPEAPIGAPSADLIVLRSDYRAMLVQVKERAQVAEARELRARRALVPALAGLALAAVAVGVTWTGWHGASARAAELAEEVPGLRAHAELLAGEMTDAQLAVGEGALALERAQLEAREAQLVHGQALAAERERRQRAEAVLAWRAVRHLLGLR